MEQGIKIKIGADIVEVTQSLNDLKNDLKSLQDQLKNATGSEFVRLNKEIERTQEVMKTLGNVGKIGFDQFGKAIKGVGSAAEAGVPALNSLGQVARDLPFGFIAIQNNLPIVVDQFSALTRTSGGVGAALKAVGGSLLGPAGLAFGFGVVISGVTSLVQKYGSLSAAASAIFIGNEKLILQQKAYASAMNDALDSIASEAAKIVSLVALYPQLNDHKKEQTEVLKKLAEAQPKYFDGLDKEKDKLGAVKTALDKYLKSLFSKILLQAEEEKFKEMIKESAGEMAKLTQKTTEATEKQRKKNQSTKEAIELDERLAKTQSKGLTGDIGGGFKPVVKVTIQDQADAIIAKLKTNIENQFKDFDVLSKIFGTDGPQGKPGADDSVLRNRLESLKSSLESLKETLGPTSKELLEVNKSIAKTDYELAIIGKKDPETIKNYFDTYTNKVKKLDDEYKILINNIKQSNREISGGGIDALAKNLQYSEKLNQFQVGGKAPSSVKAIKTTELDDQIKKFQRINELAGSLATTLSSELGNAISTFVDDLTRGQDAGENLFNNLIKGLKAVALQFVAIVVEALALYALSQVWEPLNGLLEGLGAAGKLASSFSGRKHASGGVATQATWGMIGEAGPEAIIPLSQLSYLTRQMNPQMSGNWSSGGMEVSGVLVGRGNDLLAVVNNANRVANRSF